MLAREYVWGSGDNGVDELLAQYDHNRAPTWVIQDAGLDVVALCDLGGSGGAARVVWQGVYDAYGSVLSAESLYPHAPLRAGHKGLFFDRLDAGVVDPLTGLENPRLSAGATLLGQNRNRAYLPGLGRFTQRDPNASGAILLASIMQGRALDGGVDGFDLGSLYGDGGNLFEYTGSSPWSRFDPMGLSWDPFEDADDYLAESAGSQAAFMAEIASGFDSMAHVAWQIAQFHPAVAAAVTLYKASLGTATPLDLTAMIPGGGAFKLFTRANGHMNKASRAYNKVDQLKINRLNGLASEDALRAMFGGNKKAFDTIDGMRHVDNFVNGIAQEAKTGLTHLTTRIKRQINKDCLLKEEGHIRSIEWHFFPSSTGCGPTPQLKQYLEDRGITVIPH